MGQEKAEFAWGAVLGAAGRSVCRSPSGHGHARAGDEGGEMAEQRTRANRHSAKDGSENTRVPAPSLRSAADAVDQRDVDGERGRSVAPIEPSVLADRTIRAELASIVRESALEVLAPIARKATTQATKYAISKGPSLARDAIAPRLKDTLGPRIEEAGGAGALTKNVLSAASGKRGVLARIRPGRDNADVPGLADARLRPVHEWIDVAVPLEKAFTQFTRFGDFVEFVPQAVKVEQVDDAHVVWHLRLWGLTREWEIEITDQEPNERIAWRSSGATEADGVVTFHDLTDRLTRIEVVLRLQPRGALATTASGLGIARRALRSDLTRFKAFVELGAEETDEQRGAGGEARGRSRGSSFSERGERAGERKRGARKPAPKRRDEPDEYETEDEAYDSELAEAAEDYEGYDVEDEDDEDYEPGDEEYEEEDAPSAAQDEDEPDEEEQQPATRGRGVRRRPPARPVSRSRGRS